MSTVVQGMSEGTRGVLFQREALPRKGGLYLCALGAQDSLAQEGEAVSLRHGGWGSPSILVSPKETGCCCRDARDPEARALGWQGEGPAGRCRDWGRRDSRDARGDLRPAR